MPISECSELPPPFYVSAGVLMGMNAYLITLGAVGSKERLAPYHVTSFVLDMALVPMFRTPAAGEAKDPGIEVSPQMFARAITKSG